MSLEYPDTNQIWISGIYDGWNISKIYDVGPNEVDALADTPSRKIYVIAWLIRDDRLVISIMNSFFLTMLAQVEVF